MPCVVLCISDLMLLWNEIWWEKRAQLGGVSLWQTATQELPPAFLYICIWPTLSPPIKKSSWKESPNTDNRPWFTLGGEGRIASHRIPCPHPHSICIEEKWTHSWQRRASFLTLIIQQLSRYLTHSSNSQIIQLWKILYSQQPENKGWL